MELIILRHGKAEKSHSLGDSYRELIDKGRAQARFAGGFLRKINHLPDIVLTSPLIRARQTADEFCQAAHIPGALIQGWLSCGMHPEFAIQELLGFSEFKRVAIVGHEPDLSQLIQWIIGSSSTALSMKHGALACLEIHPPSRNGILKFLIPQKISNKLDL
jgi:phosphohistidine phosphatase